MEKHIFFGQRQWVHYSCQSKIEGYNTTYTYTPTGDIETITYDDGRSVAFTYDSLRQLTEIKDWLGITKIQMDELGRTKKVKDHKGREVSYEWNKEGQQIAILYPNGKRVSYEYDEQSRLSHLLDGSREIHYIYNEDGFLISKYYPDDISSTYSYNEMGLLNSFIHQKEGKLLEQFAFSYDKMGNKIGIQKSRQSDSSSMSREMEQNLFNESGSYTYEYDCLNRLTEVKRNNETLHRYEYDVFGNRMREETDNKKLHYHYNAANQLIGAEGMFPNETYEYDGRGNLTTILSNAKIMNQYVYDETNRLAKAINHKGETAVYQYDGLGNRVGIQEYLISNPKSESLSPTKEVDYLLDRTKAYHNLLEMSEIVEGSLTEQTYTWDGNVAFMTEGENAHIYLQDEMGSPVRLLEIGVKSQTVYGYDAFGQDLYGNQGEVQPFGYTGYRKDSIANTYFAQAREYVPEMGRFWEEDRKEFVIVGKPETSNIYSYCSDNPIVFIDPLGFERIVVSGSVYKAEKQRNGKYYYEFIDAGLAQIDIWRAADKEKNITWLVANEGWTSKDKVMVEQEASRRGVDLVFVDNTSEMTEYFNSKSINTLPIAMPSDAQKKIKPREEDLITDISFFSHGLAENGGTEWGGILPLAFDYDASRNKDLDFNANGVLDISSKAFDNPITNFYSCNTGTAGLNSLAQLWVNRLGGTAYAYNGTTFYGNVPDQSLCQKIKRKLGHDIGGNTNLPVASENVERIEFSRIDD